MSRKATPSVTNELRGNPGKRKRLKEPEPEVLDLYPVPEWFKKLDRGIRDIVIKEYVFMSVKLKDLGLLTEIDTRALEAYSVCYANWQYYSIKSEYKLITTGKGYQMLSPFNSAAQRYFKELRVWLNEFGLTPASRVKFGGLGKTEEELFDEFLQKKSN